MIQVNELRIGNILTEKYTGDKLVVSELTKDRVTFDYVTYERWQSEPMPITEEILLKCGFVRDGNTDYYTCRKVGFTINLSGTIVYRTCIWSNEHIKHLHHLQNLYFALTGKELEINL